MKILNGSFSQVKDAVSKNFATIAYKDMQNSNFGRVLLSCGFFIGSMYALFAFGWYLSGDFEEPAVPLDVNNEFRDIASSIWYIHAVAIFLIIGFVTSLVYRRNNNIKGYLVINITLTTLTFFFVLYAFKLSQLIVYNFSLRVIYNVFFIATLAFVINKIYRNAMEMVYGTKKRRSIIVEWASANRKMIIGWLVGIWGISQIANATFGSAEYDFETRMIGALIDFMPLIVCGIGFVLLYMFGNLIRSFYLYKYSEEFRVMFGVEKDNWYGK